MKTGRTTSRLRPFHVAALGAILLLSAHAQNGSSSAAPASLDQKKKDETIELSPFTVTSTQDNGYVATNTLAGSRLNTKLADTPASISVLTKEFLNDIGANSVTEAIGYALDAGFDINGGNTTNRGDTGNGLIGRDFNAQVRGYRNATQTRDFFITNLDGDTYNIERIDVARGPNSLLFGVGGPSGVINTTAKQADPNRHFGEIAHQVGSWSKARTTLDVNQPLIGKKLAARVNLLYQNADGYHDFEKDNQKRGALALTWKPTDSTTVRVNGEIGKLHQNRVRPWAAVENYSKWEATGSRTFAYGTPQSPAGYLASGTGGSNRGSTLPGGVGLDQNYTQAINTGNLGAKDNGLPFPNLDIDGFVELRTFHTGFYNIFLDGPLAGKTVFEGGDPSIGGGTGTNRGARYYRTSASYNTALGNPAGFDTPFNAPDSVYPRTANIAGPGQYQNTDYNEIGVVIDQRVGRNLDLEFAANHEERQFLSRQTLGFSQISVTYDAMSYLPTFRNDYTFAASLGSPTTTGQGIGTLNFGPYTNLLTGQPAANNQGGGMVVNPYAGQMLVNYNPSYSKSDTTLDDFRVSASYHLDLGKFGDHNLLAFATRTKSRSESKSYAIGNLDPQRSSQNVSTNVPSRIRHVDVHSASLADRGIPDPWNDPAPIRNIFGVSSVVPGQPYTQEFFTPGFYLGGWSVSKRQTDAAAVAMQSRFFSDSLVTTLGARRDVIETFNSTTNTNAANGKLDRDPSTQITTGYTMPTTPNLHEGGNTYSIGAVYHLPLKSLRWLSLFANQSTNFQDQNNAPRLEDEAIRPTLPIGPLKGRGRDFGVKAAFLDDRINLTLTRFNVKQENVAVGVVTNNVTNYINAIWTTIQNGGPVTVQTDAQNPSGHHFGGSDTRSQVSNGWELELTANPTKNWRLSFNVSKSDNVVSNLGSNLSAYIEKHRSEWQQKATLTMDTSTSLGNVINAGGSNNIAALIYGLDSIFLPYTKAGEGQSELNIRPWNANGFTAYRFDRGWLKNLTVGGGINWHGPEIEGIRPPSLTDPTYQVYKGHTYYLVNAMLGYEMKLKSDTRLSLQLNVDNLLNFDDRQILTSYYNPGISGISAFYYHLLPRSYSLTAKFSF